MSPHDHSNVEEDHEQNDEGTSDASRFRRSIASSSSSSSPSSSLNFAKELLETMSLEDKIGQLSQIEINMLVHVDGDKLTLNDTAIDYYIGTKGIGSVLNTFSKPTSALEYRKIAVRLQQAAQQHNRPPVIWGLDSVHGANYVHGATLAPQPINIGATFNVTAARHAGWLASRDTRAAGINWLFSPLLGIALEPKWSRVFETFGEDPIVVRTLGNAMIQGIQQPADDDDDDDNTANASTSIPSRAAACAKHFIGYSMPRDGHDRSPSWIPTRHLYQYFVPAWRNLTALTVMESYNDYDGVPNVENHESLQYLLRQRLKFEGVLVTDYQEMLNLMDFHKTVASDQDAILSSFRQASVDMSMIPWDYDGFADAIQYGVRKHLLSQERIDQSVLRVLRLKNQLHMFDEVLQEDDPGLELVGTDEADVLDMVRQSIVLTKNDDNLLPLSKATRHKILVTGPTSSSLVYQSGAWTGQWQGAPNAKEWFTYGSTVLGALTQQADWDVSYSCGTDVLGGECNNDKAILGLIEQMEEWAGIGPHDSIARAVENTVDADVIVVCVGEEASTEKPGDIRSLRLPEGQYELVRQLRKNTTAKIVLIYFGGRPRLIGDMVNNVDAVLVAFLPGPSAGDAISGILSGEVNPSGRLPITYPLYEDGGGIPYFHSVSDLCTKGEGTLPHWEYVPCEVQWPFGHGLSYTTFAYSNLKVSGGIDEDLKVSVVVENSGARAGFEAVLLFTFDEYRTTTPEYKRLRAFDKVYLEPGEAQTVSATILLDDIRFVGPSDDRHFIVDPKMKGWVGIGSAVDCRNEQESELCTRIESKHPDRPHVAACEAACEVWANSGCAGEYQLSIGSCRSKCIAISSYPSATNDLTNDGWGWHYVDCIESVVWGFQKSDGHECQLMTSMCRDVFDQRSGSLNEFGTNSAHEIPLRLEILPSASLVALIFGLAASFVIVFFVRGGLLRPTSVRRPSVDENGDDEGTGSIQLA